MLSIKNFAKLCGCSTQTLRYYDRSDLLKPIFIGKDNRYRFYSESQITEFQKIKDLQAIGCSISEIKAVINNKDETLLSLVEQKIEAYKLLLRRAKKYKLTYQKRKMESKEVITKYLDDNTLNIKVNNNTVIFKDTKGNTCSITIQNNLKEIVGLLNAMRDEPLIALDFDTLNILNGKVSNCSKIHQGWNSVDELNLKLDDIDNKSDIIIHLFYVNNQFSIFDAAKVIDHVANLCIYAEETYFAISFSKDNVNHYAAIYHLED